MRTLVAAYVAVRRAAGFRMNTIQWRLSLFARFAEERGDTHVRVGTAIAWAAQARTPHARHIRMRDLIRFATHLRAEDPAHEVPPSGVHAYKWTPRPPRLFSDEDIAQLLAAAGRLSPAGSSRPATIQTVLALLVVTGMRVGEALRLSMSDLSPEGLRIRDTKFRKSRLLPLHPTTHAALDAYRRRWRPLGGPEDPLFVSTRGRAFSYATIVKLFLCISRDLGLRGARGRPGSASDGPRLHDLRHTFAVRALESCSGGRGAVNRHTLALSTYLGHASLAGTSWYLHATPQLMKDIADACDALPSGEPS